MASGSLGSLTLNLAVKLGEYQDGLTKAERKAKSTSDNIKKSFTGFGEQLRESIGGSQLGSVIDNVSTKLGALRGGAVVAAGAVAGLAVGGAVVAVAGLAAMSIELAKTNVELGRLASRANAPVEAFQGLSGAAASFGITSEKLSDQMRDFNEKLGEFASVGSGGAMDFFEQIAVKTEGGAAGAKKLAEQMSKMDGVTALQTYVDKLEEAGANQQQMSFYLESMGSDLTDIAPLLMNGGKLWHEYQQAMEDAGITTSEEALEQSRRLTAQTQSLQMQYTGLKNQMAQAVMPVMSSLIGYFMDGSEKGNRFGGVISAVGTIAKGVALAIIGLASAIKVVASVIGGVLNVFGNIGETIVNFVKAPTLMEKGQALRQGIVNNGNIIVDSFNGVVGAIQGAYKAGSDVINQQAGQLDGLGQALYNNSKAADEWSRHQKTGKTDGVALNKTLNDQAAAQKAAASATKKHESALKKQNDEAQKRYQLSVKEEEMLRRVASISAQHDLNGIGAKHGIPSNLLAAVMAQESKGDVNAKSNTGAIGPFQTTGIYRKHYGLSVSDSYDVRKSAEVAAKDLANSFKVFGNWTDAVTSYNAGVEGTRNLLKTGFTQSQAKTREAREYAEKVNKWYVSLNGSDQKSAGFTGAGSSAALKDYQAFLATSERLQEEAQKNQIAIRLKYSNELQKIEHEHNESIEAINRAFMEDDPNRAKYLELQRLMYQKDIEEYGQAQQKKREAAFAALNNPVAEMQAAGVEALAQSSLSPYELQKRQLNAQHQDGYGVLGDSLYAANDAINQDETMTAQQKYDELASVYEKYLQNKQNLSLLYAKQEQDLQNEQQAASLAGYGAMFGMMGSLLDGYGEKSSEAYRLAFALQKGFVFSSALLNAKGAVMAAWNDPSNVTIWQKMAAAAATVIQTNDLMSAIQGISLTGMAHDGIANVPEEGTWLLKKGERVLNEKDNKAFTSFVNQGSGKGAVSITINNHSSADVSARQNDDGSVTVDIVEKAVRQSWSQLSNPNSFESKQLRANTTAGVRR